MAKKTTAKKKSTKSSTKKKSIQKSVKAKSTTGKNVGKKFSAKKTKLIKDINLMLDQLNEENLSFLVDQCGVMYNNQKLRDSVKNISQKNETLKNQNKNKPTKKEVKIREADDGSYFIIEINDYSNFFTLNEMRKLVKMCHASNDEIDASNRIFKWFSTDRSDVKRNSLVGSSKDVCLAEVYRMIINTYDVKE